MHCAQSGEKAVCFGDMHRGGVQEANNLLDKGLPVPGYQHLLKLSHCFNILDARGAIGYTQRAKCFATMRKLAKSVTGE